MWESDYLGEFDDVDVKFGWNSGFLKCVVFIKSSKSIDLEGFIMYELF